MSTLLYSRHNLVDYLNERVWYFFTIECQPVLMTVLMDIVDEVATSRKSDPINLPPLYEAIDPEIITLFVDSVNADTATLTFTYCGLRVVVQADGEVTVE